MPEPSSIFSREKGKRESLRPYQSPSLQRQTSYFLLTEVQSMKDKRTCANYRVDEDQEALSGVVI